MPVVKLSSFITAGLEDILGEWESFARTQQPEGSDMSPLALRDHARQMLTAIALDMDTAQTPGEQYRKSQGRASPDVSARTAASSHGTLRQLSGFSLVQLNAEFRALRATVLRLWLPTVRELDDASTRDMIRFNETIDQALAESIVTYTDKAARSRDTFLAILGHDLRSPLQTMGMAGEYLAQRTVGPEQAREIGARVRRSAAAMTAMVNDLLEYARSQLGADLPVRRAPVDLAEVCRWAIDDVTVAQPDCRFALELSGDLHGEFDAVRMQQLLSNLLNNAVQYRGTGEPVTLGAEGQQDALVLRVHNTGSTIPPDSLSAIFDPLVQLAVEPDQQGRSSTSMGLGLFIAREIAAGHGGSIQATSSVENGTVFTVTLPRSSR
jgi:signal transduction histidine kinase